MPTRIDHLATLSNSPADPAFGCVPACIPREIDSCPPVTPFQHFNKTYGAEELELRRSIFAANLAKIQAHNSLKLEWTMGVNQ